MTASVAEIVIRFEAAYGRVEPRAPAPCLDTVVSCILSQHTSDVNSARAYRNLRERFPAWEDVLDAPEEEIAASIRCGGLAAVKARAIREVLQQVRQSEDKLTLERLHALSDEEARAYLIRLPGVGPKTAAIVLCFAMGRPALPVDTHVLRVSRRLGLLPANTTAEKAHGTLERLVPPELVYRFHVGCVRHGKRTCRARKPSCTRCCLADVCPAVCA